MRRSTNPRTRWLMVGGLLATFMVATSVPQAVATTAGVTADPVTVVRADAGYLGCVQAATFAVTYCFAATATGSVTHLTVETILSDGSKSVEVTVAENALSRGTDPTGGPTVTLSATSPTLGSIALTSTTQAPAARLSSNAGCGGYPLTWALASSTAAVRSVWKTTGSINGQPVDSWSVCDVFFTATSRIAWSFVSG